MGATEDPALIQEMFHFLLFEARDQHLHSFFMGLKSNPKTRRPLADFFRDNFETVFSYILHLVIVKR
jgi:aminopeptidase 2